MCGRQVASSGSWRGPGAGVAPAVHSVAVCCAGPRCRGAPKDLGQGVRDSGDIAAIRA